ncbi:MAG TPA: MBL fold metallo-hydrolase [Syntrophomonadaceae bacterium]|nr:MBL fold metallo-hydrolase [Syntrophomonadaceae bacterium]
MVSFKILGTSAGPGVPAFYCNCRGCQEARQNPQLARTRTSAFLDTGTNKILIDAGPDIRSQMIKESITDIDTVFLTHWHADHYSGLGEFEYYVKLLTHKKLDLYLPASAVVQFYSTFPDLIDVFHIIPWEYQKEYFFGGLCLTPLWANHGIETAGFLLETRNKRIAYFPDTAGLPNETAKQLRGIDYLICDATFYGENWYPDTHMNCEQAIQLGKKINAQHTVLTHLSIHYSQAVTTRQLEQEFQNIPGVIVARDGMSIDLL